MSEEKKEGTGAGAVIGFQVPVGIKKRKLKVDELLKRNSDINEGHVLSYLNTLDESEGEAVGRWLDLNRFDEVAGWVREHAIREVIAQKVKEVVRKKPGGSGYALYAPNPGKRKGSKEVSSFPTKVGAKRAELARYPPKDPQKLARLRKQVQRMAKKPEKPEPKAKKPAKTEGVMNEDRGDLGAFMGGLKALPKTGPERGKYITQHMSDPTFIQALQKHPQGKQLHQQLMGYLNSPVNAGPQGAQKLSVGGSTAAQPPRTYSPTANPAQTPNLQNPAQARVSPIFQPQGLKKPVKPVQLPASEAVLRNVIAKLIKESLFREERSGSAWDEVIGQLSSKALTGDKKFQTLQRNIEKKTQSTLEQALSQIAKAVKAKDVKVHSLGIKHSPEHGKIYMPFEVELGESDVGPIAVYIEAGVPRIELSDEAKVAMTRADPDLVKEFRANLVLCQERVLDRMDDLTVAIESRDRYLEKVEGEVDKFVAGLSPLQLSLMKRLLIKKYRKMG